MGLPSLQSSACLMIPYIRRVRRSASSVSEEDYFNEATGVWDVEGLEDDLRLNKERAKGKLEAMRRRI